MKIFIHVGGLKSHENLSSKLKVPSLSFTLMHKPSSFAKMQKMFQEKNASNLEGKMVVEVKIVTTNVNVVDINVVTRSIIIEDQMF
jgi:hypothetical protein